MEDVILHTQTAPRESKTVTLNEEMLSTVFQPIVRLGTPNTEVFGYEALTRGPAGTPIEEPTKMFINAQEQGVLTEVDMMCLRRVLYNSRLFPKGPKIFVNIHPSSLGKNTKACSDILQYMKDLHLDTHQFVIELVEQFPFHNIDVFMSNVFSLRKEGALIGLDDIGAGYSDFFVLSKIKPDFLKIGGYFADHIHMNSIKQKVVKAVVDLSQEFNAKVIAEGIERKEDLRTIESLGVHLGQGFFFARPDSIEKFNLKKE